VLCVLTAGCLNIAEARVLVGSGHTAIPAREALSLSSEKQNCQRPVIVKLRLQAYKATLWGHVALSRDTPVMTLGTTDASTSGSTPLAESGSRPHAELEPAANGWCLGHRTTPILSRARLPVAKGSAVRSMRPRRCAARMLSSRGRMPLPCDGETRPIQNKKTRLGQVVCTTHPSAGVLLARRKPGVQ
jgi:hypothetical protein